MKYVLGLDIGISSVGWAVLNQDLKRIEDLGVRAFSAAEQPKNKSPLAEPRRLARSARRRLRRRSGRLRRIKELFVSHGMIPASDTHNVFVTTPGKPDPWELRARSLDQLLSPEDLARVLFHIAKRRGYKSNRKVAADKEEGRMLESILHNRRVLEEKGYRTAGEMLFKDDRFQAHKRNKADSYEHTLERSMLEDEVNILFDSQRRLGNPIASPEFQKEFLDLFHWQLPFATGDAILAKVGRCTFEQDEYRAPKNTPTVERFVLLQKMNQLAYHINGSTCSLTPEQRGLVVQDAYKRGELKYTHIRKLLSLPDAARFPGLLYAKQQDGATVESLDCEKAAVVPMNGFKALKKTFSKAGLWDDIKDDTHILDHVASALTLYKTEDDIQAYLTAQGISEPVIAGALEAESFSKFGHLSLKALSNILPYMEAGDIYSIACEKAGYNHSGPSEGLKSKKLPLINPDDIRNPVVLRSLTQARKVVNAIIERYGSPYRIHIELARDIGKTADERDKISRRQEENRKIREQDKEHFLETLGAVCPNPNGEDILKWRLYREQNGQCAYCHQALDLPRLLESGYVEIDHVLPYSRSFDDRPMNKVLVLGRENRLKKNMTPYEYFGADAQRWDNYEAWVNSTIRDYRKRQVLLRKHFDDNAEHEWQERNLNDTRWIGRYLSNFMRDNLIFSDDKQNTPVVCLGGQVTSLVRGLWGLTKNREENDLHHALDATVAATLTPGLIKRITEYRKLRELQRLHPGEDYVVDMTTGEIIEFRGARHFAFPLPWKHFRKELLARLFSDDPAAEIASLNLPTYPVTEHLRPVMVSRMPYRKVTGAIHKETIRSAKYLDEGFSTVRKRLVDLKISDLENLHAPETNVKLYAAIRQRREKFGGNAQQAFAEPLHKPTNDGSLGPVVKSVKLRTTQKSGIGIRGGMAENAEMVRVDVSQDTDKNGNTKYYMAPVYTCDIMNDRLPEIRGRFIFSLYPYDLIRIVRKDDVLFGYYRKYNTNTQSVTICEPNNSQSLRGSIGIRNAESIEKHVVDPLGEYHLVKGERRIGVEGTGNQQSGETPDTG